MAQIVIECKKCGGSGISRMVQELQGTGLICVYCEGTGSKKIKYRPFKARRRIEGCKKVQFDAGMFIDGARGAFGKAVSYEAWLKGAQPSLPDKNG